MQIIIQIFVFLLVVLTSVKIQDGDIPGGPPVPGEGQADADQPRALRRGPLPAVRAAALGGDHGHGAQCRQRHLLGRRGHGGGGGRGRAALQPPHPGLSLIVIMSRQEPPSFQHHHPPQPSLHPPTCHRQCCNEHSSHFVNISVYVHL